VELSEHPILAAIPPEHRRTVGIARQSFPEGDILLHAGQHMEAVYFVLKGEVRLVHRDPSLGTRSVVETASPGEAVVLPTDVTDRVSRFEAVAATPLDAAVIAIDDFAGLLSRCIELVRVVVATTAARLRVLEDRFNAGQRSWQQLP